ncbi:uncharacterized protein LOC132756154 [Ruditapes philippinarum]|uniref:uncharacterized protein LOC132756154 n=1 Tax=Ruditapes philippinarum TaxID=129788 RepID=UPI00295A5AA4|nr:uncharacterized protein LOC132756154 [Ruditapes philippinarum]
MRKCTGKITEMRQCDKCPYSTINRDLSRHLKRHKEALYPCDICDMPFFARGHLNGHKETVHGIARAYVPRIYKCKKCDYETKHCSDHSRHMKRHENAPDSCKYCNRPFFNIENMKRHIRRDHKQIKQIKEDSKCSKRDKPYGKVTHKGSEDVTLTQNNPQDGKDTTKTIDKLKEQIERRRKNSEVDLNTNVEKDNLPYSREAYSSIASMNKNKVFECNRQYVKDKTISCRKRNEKDERTHTDKSYIEKEIVCAKGILHKNVDGELLQTKKKTKTNRELRFVSGSNAQKFKLLSCAFCEFYAESLKELREHLDEHDYDMDVTDHSDSENVSDKEIVCLNFSVESISCLSDSEMVPPEHNGVETNCNVDSSEGYASGIDSNVQSPKCDNDESVSVDDTSDSLDSNDLSNANVFIDNDSNMFLIRSKSETSNESTSNADSFPDERDDSEGEHEKEECNDCDNETNHIKYSTSEKSVKTTDAIGKSDISLTDLEHESDYEFIMRPFACSKCMFTTGNLEHLKVHVEAHLYDAVRVTNGVENEKIKSHLSRVTDQCTSNVVTDIEIEMNDRGKPVDEEIRNTTDIALHEDSLYSDDSDCDDNTNAQDINITKHSKSIGRLKKEDFKKNKKCYKKHTLHGRTTFECLICNKDSDFGSRNEIKEHFRNKHIELREKVCKTCHYCSKPFPK